MSEENVSLAYARAARTESKSIESELSRLAARVKVLKAQKKKSDERIFRYMITHGLQEFEGVKRSKIEPKPKKSRAKKGEKEKHAIQLFTDAGIPNPKELWQMLQLKKEEEKK